MPKTLMLGALLAVSISSAFADRVEADPGSMRLCEIEMKRAAAKFGVPLGMLYSVGLTETGHKGSLHPYALNIQGRAVFAKSKMEARQKFADARGSGIALIDLGCMQINAFYHGEKFTSVDQMLDPRANVEYAARFLSELKQRHETWTMAVARYHAGPNNNPAQKRYVCRVISNMVATGFGKWTPAARDFCD